MIMPYNYIPELVSKYECIGNSLSTFNISLTALDDNLGELSTYTVESVNFLSATMISVSSELYTIIETTSSNLYTLMDTTSSNLLTEIYDVSSNVINDYITPGVLTQAVNGTIDWDVNLIGVNARLNVDRNGTLNNPTNLQDGQSGNLTVSATVYSLTGFGDKWIFSNGTSAIGATDIYGEGLNLIRYVYMGYVDKILADLDTF